MVAYIDTSWIWAVELTIFHAIASITIPILLVELLFPAIADRPWLKKERSVRIYYLVSGCVVSSTAVVWLFIISQTRLYASSTYLSQERL